MLNNTYIFSAPVPTGGNTFFFLWNLHKIVQELFKFTEAELNSDVSKIFMNIERKAIATKEKNLSSVFGL